MTVIYLIRHTQAEGNLYRIMQGHWDGGVTEAGCAQIDALAERFRELPVDALYSSDLYRARRTAGAVSVYHDLPLHTDPALREINMGDWEARFFADLIHEDSEEIRTFLTDPTDLRIPGGESCREVGERMCRALERIAQENDGKVTAVVSHGMAIRCALARINNCRLSEQPIVRNTSVSRLIYENGAFTVDYIDDVSHLPDAVSTVWTKVPALHARYYVPGEDDELYLSCYADAWRAAHGGLEGFSPRLYLDAALKHYHADRHSIILLYEDEVFAGLVDLDTQRSSENGVGWISLLYLTAEYRRRGCGVQLLGRAIVHYRQLGRQVLGLTAAEDNTAALAFYKKYGFSVVASEKGCVGRLLRMETSLESRR